MQENRIPVSCPSFYIAIAEVDDDDKEDNTNADADAPTRGFWKGIRLLLQPAGALTVVVCGLVVASQYVLAIKRKGYETVPKGFDV